MALFEALPADLNELIASAVSANLNLRQFNTMCSVNKTWKGAVESGRFGALGRLLRPGLPKVALLFRADAEEESEESRLVEALPAVGVVDAAAGRIHILPRSTTSAPFDLEFTRPVVLGRSILLFTDLRRKLAPFGLTDVRPTAMSSFDLVTGVTKVYPPEFLHSEKEGVFDLKMIHVDVTVPLDKHRFAILGYCLFQKCPPLSRFQRKLVDRQKDVQHRSSDHTSCLVLICDSRTPKWLCLPPLPFSIQNSRYPICCYVSQGRIWIGDGDKLYSITTQTHQTMTWRRENARVAHDIILDAPPHLVKVLSLSWPVLGVGMWEVVVQTKDQIQYLTIPLHKKAPTVCGALAVAGDLLAFSPEGAYLSGREMTYVWGKGAGAAWSPRKCRVLWAAALGAHKRSERKSRNGRTENRFR